MPIGIIYHGPAGSLRVDNALKALGLDTFEALDALLRAGAEALEEHVTTRWGRPRLDLAAGEMLPVRAGDATSPGFDVRAQYVEWRTCCAVCVLTRRPSGGVGEHPSVEVMIQRFRKIPSVPIPELLLRNVWLVMGMTVAEATEI
jgi:hypothetical protein